MKSEWKTVSIGEVLNQAQIQRLDQMFKDCDDDLNKVISQCKIWFNEPAMVNQLYKAGFVPSFAAYSLPYHFLKAKRNS